VNDPAGVSRPILWVAPSVNHRFPSGPGRCPRVALRRWGSGTRGSREAVDKPWPRYWLATIEGKASRGDSKWQGQAGRPRTQLGDRSRYCCHGSAGLLNPKHQSNWEPTVAVDPNHPNRVYQLITGINARACTGSH
jgi:hypothetical protein